MKPKATLVEFRWGGEDDPLDYLSFVSATPKEREQIRTLLRKAELNGLIDTEWYVGDCETQPKSFRPFMKQLTRNLNLDDDEASGHDVMREAAAQRRKPKTR